LGSGTCEEGAERWKPHNARLPSTHSEIAALWVNVSSNEKESSVSFTRAASQVYSTRSVVKTFFRRFTRYITTHCENELSLTCPWTSQCMCRICAFSPQIGERPSRSVWCCRKRSRRNGTHMIKAGLFGGILDAALDIDRSYVNSLLAREQPGTAAATATFES